MPVPQMLTGAAITLIDAIAVDRMAERWRLVGDEDFGWDGVGAGANIGQRHD